MSGVARVLHLTTVDMSLSLLLLPQLVGLRDAGYEVIGVSAPGQHVPELRAEGIGHLPLRTSTRGMDLRADVTAARDFVSICRSLQPDIVHTHNPKPGLYGRLGARLARVPHVVNTVHGLYALPTDRLLKRIIVYGAERIAASCSDAELLQNPEDLPVLRRLGVPESKLYLLGNGIDLSRFDPDLHAGARAQVRRELGVSEDEVLVGLVGRLVAEKGYREVFEAARRLRGGHPGVRFVVVGPTDADKSDAISQADLEDASRDLGVVFLGMRSDVERLYAAMDLYVLASHREGFPRSAMEAAAMGLPVLATDVRGCRQVVDHGRTGLLLPVAAPDALAAAIGALALAPDERRRMGRAGRRKARHEFDVERQTQITLGVYEALLARSRPGPVRT
jgi:glycosyltransferase involved in cell wall biosynthesis